MKNSGSAAIGWILTGVFLTSIGVAVTASAAAPRIKGKKAEGVQDYGLAPVRKINAQIRLSWQDHEIQPSAAATDGEWCRRVYLDVLGRIPTVEELEAFVRNTSPEKKKQLIGMLLYDDKYTEEYARNWTTIWTNVLIGRSGGAERNSLTNREGLQKYLRDSFARNKPYDRMVSELVTATGSNTPGTKGFNGAVNFLTMKLDENAAQATAQTSKVFLGLQVQCTQCHNHPFNEWKQQKYWEMNAFFRQTRGSLRRFVPTTRNVESAELVDQDYAGESNTPADADIFYERRDGVTKVAYPVFVDGTAIAKSGYVSEVNRRRELAKLMLQSSFLDKMIVNRTWAHFMGYGFTKPIDDLGPHNPPSHPELLEELAKQFRSASYNIKDLTTWIVLSEPYSLGSRTNKTNAKTDDPQLGESPKFSRFYLRQMRAEELYESLLVATQAHKARGSYEEQERTKARWLQQFTVAFGNDEGEEATTFNGTIPQALMMFNGDLIKQATRVDKGSSSGGLAADTKMSPKDKIDHLFKAALARRASKDEAAIGNKLLYARKGNMPEALKDLWWAVLNSNEFIMNH